MSDDLTGKRVLVTGGASGIGLACARNLAERGADVIIADVDQEATLQAAAQLGVQPWHIDLADTRALDRMELKVDILVNNAGYQRVNPLQDFDPDDYRRMMRVMLEAPFLLVRSVLPHMYARSWGRIVNVSSAHGRRASAYKSAYVAAKHGLEGLSKVAALEGAQHGVTSNCVSPGYVRTPLVEKQVAAQARVHGLDENEVLSRVILAETAVKALIEPGDVASLIGWLVSDDARMVTGASFAMDGGWTAS